MYHRLRVHFQFQNELKLFSEIGNRVKFSINIYGYEQVPAFRTMANVLHPQTTFSSLAHLGGGVTPGIKNEVGKWDLSGHRNRIVDVTKETLEIFALLYDEPGSSGLQARLPAVHSRELVSVLNKFSRVKRRLVDETSASVWFFDESASQHEGTIRRKTGFVTSPPDFILSGPHFYVGNPLSKTPKRVCETHKAYDILDLESLPEEYLPRSNYIPACSPTQYANRTPRVSWIEDGESEPRPVTDYFRHINREMISASMERTLISALIPKGYGHLHACISTTFPSIETLLGNP